ncbi:MAG: hypothetical protein JXN59_13940, partial [Anaerolineae bacterium]|nr:hypothetical protein [Anaerolineae bacterium]
MMLKNRGIWLLVLVLLVGTGGPVRAQGGDPISGLRVEGRYGGMTRALATLPDGRILLGEDGAIISLDETGQPLGRVEVGRGAVQAIAARGQLAYVLTEQGVSVRQVADWAELAFQPGGGQALYVSGRAIYVAAQAAGIRAAALDRRGLPGGWQAVPTPAPALELVVDSAERMLYAALGEAGIGIYALPLEGPPQPVGALDAVGRVDGLRIEGAHLLAFGGQRLLAFDLAEPAVPRLVAAYDPLHDAADVLLRHEWAYVADRAGGLRRFLIAPLTRPRPEAELFWDGPVHALVDDVRYLYAAAGWDGLVVFDVGRLDALTVHAQLALPGEVTALALREEGDARWLLAGLDAAGIAVVAWQDGAAPRLQATIATDAPVRAVAMRDRLAFVGLESGEVQVYSLASLEAPRLLASLEIEGAPQDFAQDGTLLF